MMPRTLLFAIFAIVATFASGIQAVPCFQHDEIDLYSYSGRSVIKVENGTAMVFAIGSDGSPITYASVGMTWLGAQELTRVSAKCLEADSFPDIPGGFGNVTIHRTVESADMECTIETVEEDFGNGLFIKTVIVHATHPTYPDLVFAYNISTPSRTENVTVDHPQTRVIEYVENTFKFAFQIRNWPWATSDPQSYLVTAFGATFRVPSDFTAVSAMQNDTIVMTVDTDDGMVSIRQVFDATFYLDGQEFIHLQPRPEFSAHFPGPLEMVRTYSYAFCEFGAPGFHYDVADYDPSLAILINEPITPSANPDTPIAKSNKGVLIASIVVPLACVAVVAGVISYFVFKKKADPLAGIRRNAPTSPS